MYSVSEIQFWVWTWLESPPNALSQFSKPSLDGYISNFFEARPKKHIDSCLHLFTSMRLVSIQVLSHYLKVFQYVHCGYKYFNISFHSCCYRIHGKLPILLFLNNSSSLIKHSQDISRSTAGSRGSLSTTQLQLLTQKEAFSSECQAFFTQMQDVACFPFPGFIRHGMIPE